jgi:NTE family protein
MDEAAWVDDNGNHLDPRTYRDEFALTDGGVYDNLGLETAWNGTRLKALPDRDQERLINWGYAIADAGLRAHIDHNLRAPIGYPYARGVS